MVTKVRSQELEVRRGKLEVGSELEVRSGKLKVGSRRRKVKNLCTLYFVLFSFFFSLSANAQCAMCRAALTSEGNKAKAESVNDGIVYLMVIPYVLVGIIGYVVYRMYTRKNKKG